MKIGKGEREILDYLEAREGVATCVCVVGLLAPTRKQPGDRVSHIQYNVIRTRLDRMQQKGLVRIENPNRTDCRVRLP